VILYPIHINQRPQLQTWRARSSAHLPFCITMAFGNLLIALVCTFKSAAGLQDLHAGGRSVGSSLRSPPSAEESESPWKKSEALQQPPVLTVPTGDEERAPLLDDAQPTPEALVPSPDAGLDAPQSEGEALVAAKLGSRGDPEISAGNANSQHNHADLSKQMTDSALTLARSSVGSAMDGIQAHGDHKFTSADAYRISLEYFQLSKDAARVAAHYKELEAALRADERDQAFGDPVQLLEGNASHKSGKVVEAVSGDGAITGEEDRQSDLLLEPSPADDAARVVSDLKEVEASLLGEEGNAGRHHHHRHQTPQTALLEGKITETVGGAGVMLRDSSNQSNLHTVWPLNLNLLSSSRNDTNSSDEVDNWEKMLTLDGKLPLGVGIAMFVAVDLCVCGCFLAMFCALVRGV